MVLKIGKKRIFTVIQEVELRGQYTDPEADRIGHAV
jgi:hypothetical protein